MKEYTYTTELGTLTFHVQGTHLKFAKIEFFCDLPLGKEDLKDLDNPEYMQKQMRDAVRKLLDEKEEDDKQTDG